MTTLGDVTEDILNYLNGWGAERDKQTALASPIGDTTSTTLTVTEGGQVDRGFIEVDDEIMAVIGSDTGTGVVTLQPWGRGVNGSAVSTHQAGARVVSNPRFPRARVKATVNQIVSELFPQLFAVGVDSSQTATAPRVAYPVDARAESILSMSVQYPGPENYWAPITRYKFDNTAFATVFSTGKSVAIFDPLPPGRIIKIVYRYRFSQFTGSDSQTFASVGLLDDYRGLIALGAQARLLAALDAPRLQLGTVESADRAQYNQPGGATAVARELQKNYQQQVADMRGELLRLYPGTIVRQS